MILMLWTLIGLAAPSDDDEAVLDPAEDLSAPVAARPGLRPRVDLTGGVGVMVHAGGLGASPAVRVGGGWTLDRWDGRLRLLGSLGWTRPGSSGRVLDERYDPGVDWRVGQHRAHLGLGAAWSVVGDGADLDGEIVLEPRAVLVHTRVRSALGASTLGTGTETALRPGAWVAAGITGPLATGEGALHLGASLTPASGVITGQTSVVGLHVLASFRHVLRERS